MKLQGLKAVAIVHDIFEDLELWAPVYRLIEEGCEVRLAGEKPGTTYTGKHGVPCTVDMAYDEMKAEAFDCLLVPGGFAPDKLRRYESILAFTRQMDAQQKPIGQICHAGWVLISAKILEGRKVTSTPGIKDDMVNAGAIWVDEPAVIDGHIVSAQRPPQIPQYNALLVSLLERYMESKKQAATA